ncbi:MAG: RNA 2',3'-cyclic phosphodiesterase [Candidatus Omnitrophica bacterium]|nr:RNA 2',3'-cyclic phosphodiesterase [Candidatus Omnitrophota bacterium]
MRIFIAIQLPDKLKEYLSSIQERLKKTGADVKWVEPHNIHLTLKFLGEIEKKKLEDIIKIIERIAKNKKEFTIQLSSLGAFPKIDFPRVIWIGINKGQDQTKQIVQELEEGLFQIGIPKEKRPFLSHITIGRVRSSLNRKELASEIGSLQTNLENNKLEFVAKGITLFKSILTPQGPIYEALKEINLATI